MRNKYVLIAVLVGVPLGWLAGAIIAEDDGFVYGTVTGIATGFVTGTIASGYVAWRDRAWVKWGAKVRARYQAEGVIHHGQARLGYSVGVDVVLVLFRAWHLLGRGTDGWLVLTKQRVVFQPRGIGRTPVELDVADLAGARRGDSVIPNTIALKMHGSGSIEIRVQKRDEWLDKLASLPSVTVVR